MHAVEQEDVARAFGQGADHLIDMAQPIAGFEDGVGAWKTCGALLGYRSGDEVGPRTLGADMIDRRVADTACEIGGIAALKLSPTAPQPQKYVMDEIGRSGGVSDHARDLAPEANALRQI